MIIFGPHIKNYDDDPSRVLINGKFRKATMISNLILNLFAI